MGDPISWLVWLGVVCVLLLVYKGIGATLDSLRDLWHDFHRQEPRGNRPYDWQRNGQ